MTTGDSFYPALRAVLIATLVLSGFTSPSLLGQPPGSPQFGAATIKPSGLCEGGGGPQPGRLKLRCLTVEALIQMAYGYFANGIAYTPKILHISGGPGWIHSDHYDIEATAEGDSGQALMRGPMLQALLEDRFRLRVRRETVEGAVYALSVGTNGIRMPRMPDGSCVPVDLKRPSPLPAPGSVSANPCGTETRKKNGQMLTVNVRGISVADLADGILVELSGRTVIDKTGVSGLFDFHLEFSPDQNAALSTDDAAGPSIFTALREQLGLKLESAKGPVKILAIDHVERPSPN